MKNIISLFTLCILSQYISAFSPIVTPRRTLKVVDSTTSSLASSREEEIAKLEEQLRKLKEEETNSSSTVGTQINGEINDVEKRLLEKVQGKDMILSEQDLYDGNIAEDQSTEGNVVQNVLVALVTVVFLGLFSQIPIGQEDLSKY